jgi:hypothetical protein
MNDSTLLTNNTDNIIQVRDVHKTFRLPNSQIVY